MKKILILEDDISIAELQRDYLEINQFDVDIEARGDEGLQRALNHDYDLIILDIMLPGKDGFEICKEIRLTKNTPILLVSAKKEDIDKVRGLGLGADDYMTKPFSPNELVARVRAHIARFERLTSNEDIHKGLIQVGEISIEQLSRSVFVNQKETNLTTKEFDLLYLLAQNPQRVFRKEELFETIWGWDSFGDISTVTVHIRRIREKIERDPSNPKYIETIWGVGYKFRA
ncbi:two component transcriptional regulator, winged helix family [Alkaliphilus metalliredigens QYMF]|uniref:Stage 0 sporulation protein A homolog n=1 Tax=Alkaliphilus metalliredigens (strain QYMF) TaxID=293826 RepID=A6TL13_ALKMQ|nr:response regulator transcription factor [Alkaliphilus metalliredigens]ABR46881.1 two component transcriptional regulator, winged helix family [Alkaliphilus metalliredigens QYMF]